MRLQAADRELPLPVQQSQHQGGYLVCRTLRQGTVLVKGYFNQEYSSQVFDN